MWCKRTDVSHLVVKLHSLYRCRLVRQTPYACSEMMKASGGFGSSWMTDLINNIVKEGCMPDDWRKSILVAVYKWKCDPLVCGSYQAIRLLRGGEMGFKEAGCG